MAARIQLLGRRGFLAGLAAPLLSRRGWALEVERILKDYPLPATTKQLRAYRADAAILFLGMTLFRRPNVGGGSIAFEECRSDDARRTGITFKAGSLPDRARGLNRLGYIQEVCLEKDSVLREAAYFGVMTSSPEETFADAKNALDNQNKQGLRYTAIDGVNNAGAARSASHHWVFPADYDWSKCDAVVESARDRIRSASGEWRRLPSEASATPGTFLNAVLRAVRAPEPRSQAGYVFGNTRYKLATEKAREANGVLKLRGEIVNQSTGKKTNFAVWFEGPDALPLRIEFQPRSYLRLTFEAI